MGGPTAIQHDLTNSQHVDQTIELERRTDSVPGSAALQHPSQASGDLQTSLASQLWLVVTSEEAPMLAS